MRDRIRVLLYMFAPLAVPYSRPASRQIIILCVVETEDFTLSRPRGIIVGESLGITMRTRSACVCRLINSKCKPKIKNTSNLISRFICLISDGEYSDTVAEEGEYSAIFILQVS